MVIIMSKSINTFDINKKDLIGFRDVKLKNNEWVRTVNINQLNGSFVTTEPLSENGLIKIYPQSPNNDNYNISTYKSFTNYINLKYPLDAKINYISGNIWVADAGNNNVISISNESFSVNQVIKNIKLPHSVVPEINSNGIFIKAFKDLNNGVIYYYNRSAQLLEEITYPFCSNINTLEMQGQRNFINSLPLPSSMTYDHVRWRLWWVANNVVYMMDIKNQQIVENKLDYQEGKSVDIELSTGNAFVIMRNHQKEDYIVKIFRDNNYIFCDSYILED